MKRLIPGTCGIFITDTCDIVYFDDTPCKLPIKDDKVSIVLYGKECNIDKHFLMLYSWFEVPDFISIDHIYFMRLNVPRKQFPYRVMLTVPYYADYNHEYKIVPSFKNLAVSKTGECYNYNTFEVMHQHIGKTGYSYVNVYDPLVQDWRHVGVHQLIASAWVMSNQDQNNFVVNHIDGNRSNNIYTNLEWCTPEYNTKDGINRLKESKDIIGKVRNIDTGEITEFRSLTDMCKFMKVHRLNYPDFKGAKINRLFGDKFEVRLTGDERPWFYTDEVKNKKTSKYVIQVTDPSGDISTFNGTVEFRSHYGLSGHSGVEDTIKKFKSKFPEYIVTYTNLDPDTIFEVKDIVSGVITEYKTRKDISDALHISWDKVNSLVASKGTKCYRNFCMRPKIDKDWPEYKDMIPKLHPLKITDRITKEIYLFPSISAACEDLNMTKVTIHRHISNPHIDDRYSIEFHTS